jgi:hypothetical protein
LGIINLEVFIMNLKCVNRRLALAFAIVFMPSLSMLATRVRHQILQIADFSGSAPMESTT